MQKDKTPKNHRQQQKTVVCCSRKEVTRCGCLPPLLLHIAATFGPSRYPRWQIYSISSFARALHFLHALRRPFRFLLFAFCFTFHFWFYLFIENFSTKPTTANICKPQAFWQRAHFALFRRARWGSAASELAGRCAAGKRVYSVRITSSG